MIGKAMPISAAKCSPAIAGAVGPSEPPLPSPLSDPFPFFPLISQVVAIRVCLFILTLPSQSVRPLPSLKLEVSLVP